MGTYHTDISRIVINAGNRQNSNNLNLENNNVLDKSTLGTD